MSIFMIDIESDGPIPGKYSMIALGAVIVDEKLDRTFYRTMKPISNEWLPEALKISGFTREDTLNFDPPEKVMLEFQTWANNNISRRPFFCSDNNGFDWQFVNWYFIHFIGENPFGHSSTNINSLYKGIMRDFSTNFKHLRNTVHSHNALDDAIGNAEALLHMKNKMGLRFPTL